LLQQQQMSGSRSSHQPHRSSSHGSQSSYGVPASEGKLLGNLSNWERRSLSDRYRICGSNETSTGGS
jgi:hypothetical protein